MKKRIPPTPGPVALDAATTTNEFSPTALLCRLDPVLCGLARKIAGERVDLREDYFQEGALGALQAMASFVPSKGNLDHYATRCAHGRMLNYRRSLRRRANELSVGLFNESDQKEERIPAAYSAQLLLTDREQARSMENRVDAMGVWALAATILSPNERRVIQSMFFDGMRANEVGRNMRLSAPRITQLYAAGVAKLRARFGY